MRKRRDIQEFTYPIKVGVLRSLVNMFKPSLVLLSFHLTMTLLLISGLMLDFLGPWIGSYTVRLFHGYVGMIFFIIFAVYIGIIAINKEFRDLREPINYVEIGFYAALTVFGAAIKFPNLIPFLNPISPFHCTVLTYGWLVVSVIGGGGIVQGLSSLYFIILRARSHTSDSNSVKVRDED